MSQENNLNLNIAGILNEIKGMSDEQIEQIENNWREIPAERVLIYKGVMSALESNNYEQMRGKFYELACSIFAQNAVITQLDVEIIMSFVEKVLEKVGDQNPESQQWTAIVKPLFDSLGRATLKLFQSGTKIKSQDLKNVISLAGEVSKCGNVAHKNLCFAVNNVFAAINNFISMLSENIEKEDTTTIISLAEIVADDKDIKWDNVSINSIFYALGGLLVKSSNLGKQQAVDMVELITKFTDKLKLNGGFLIQAVSEMLDTLRVLLLNKNNPSNLDAKDCMDLVGNLLKKIDILNTDEYGCEDKDQDPVRTVTNLLTDIVQYYTKNEENIAIIENCGFNIENGQIKSFDADKLKEFAGEFMAKAIQQVLFPNLCKSSELENEGKDGNENDNQVKDNEINSTEKDNHGEMLSNYKSANELLTSNEDKQIISGYLKNVEVRLVDKFKSFFSWLWFMICNQKLVSLDIYTRAVKYYSEQQNQNQDANQTITDLDNKNQDNSKGKIRLKDKIQGAVDTADKNKQLNPEFKNNHENDETLGKED